MDSSSEPSPDAKTCEPAHDAGSPTPGSASQKRKRDATAKQPKATDERVRPTIDKFDACYRASRGGQPYAVDGWRDGKAIKSLSAAYTSELLGKLIEAYFADDGSFWSRSRTIAFFVRWLNDDAGGAAFQRISAGGSVEQEEDEFAAADRRIEAQRRKWEEEQSRRKASAERKAAEAQ